MFDRILVPLDGSKVGEAALPFVRGIISKLSSIQKIEITLLQVVSSLVHYVVAGEASVQVPYTDREVEMIKKEARDYLDKVAEGLRSIGADVKVRVVAGNAAEGIIKIADEIKADMVAMSTHGRSGLSRWAFGSVAEKVLQGASVPVLMVRAPKGSAEAEVAR